MNTGINNTTLTQLIARLHALDSGREARLPPQLSAEVTRVLESCLADRDLLKLYMSVLQSVSGGHARHNGEFHVERLENLAESGLRGLDEGTLICLALDPVSLWCLHDIIVEEEPQSWAPFRKVQVVACRDGANAPQLARSDRHEQGGIPWAELDCLSEPGFSHLLELMRHGSGVSSACPMTESDLPTVRAAASQKRLPSSTCSLRTARLAASQEQLIPNETCSPTLGVIRRHGAPFTFFWRGAQYTLSADADAVVYVDAPSTVTHLKVGETSLYPLQSTETEGLFLVTGVKRPQLRRRIEAGEAVTFWSQDTEDE